MFSDSTLFNMAEKLSIASFNCKNFKSSIDEIRLLCDHNDVILLQETWLTNTELPILDQLHSEFYAKGISAMNLEEGVLTGRPYGGVAILWRKSITSKFQIVDCNDTRLFGLELVFGDKKIIIFNVYLPYCSNENAEEFIQYLEKK